MILIVLACVLALLMSPYFFMPYGVESLLDWPHFASSGLNFNLPPLTILIATLAIFVFLWLVSSVGKRDDPA